MAIFSLKQKFSTSYARHLCGIQLLHAGIAVAYVTEQANTLSLKFSEFISCPVDIADPQKNIAILSKWVKKNQLEQTKCAWVLRPCDYTVLPLGVLPVAQNEIAQAMQFYIKDRINFPLEKACITYFTAPHVKQSLQEDFVYAFVAQKKFLEQTAHMINASGLQLCIIDAPELAFRNNVLYFYPTDSASEKYSIGLLDITQIKATMMIMQKGIIKLMRQIELPSEYSFEQNLEKITEEIQRSIDYYENELGQNTVNKIYLPPGDQNAIFFPELTEQFSVELMSINPHAVNCFFAIGAALRVENRHATAN